MFKLAVGLRVLDFFLSLCINLFARPIETNVDKLKCIRQIYSRLNGVI